MPKRCSDTHFYVSGHKTRSGHARYTTPDGTELEVVCGRNRPGAGQIHLRDVPDGVPLSVTGKAGTLSLTLDQAATRGRRGRMAIAPYVINADKAELRTFVANCVAELPHTAGEGRGWAQRVVHELVATRGMAAVPDRALRHATPKTWKRMLASENYTRGLSDRYVHHVRQLVHALSALDPSSPEHRYTLNAAVALIAASGAPLDARLRLNAHVVRHAATNPAVAQQALRIVKAAPLITVTGLARTLSCQRGAPFASRSRALGTSCYDIALSRAENGPERDRWWPAAAILADPNAAALHQSASRSIAWVAAFGPGEFGPSSVSACTYQLACPAAQAVFLPEFQRTHGFTHDEALAALTARVPRSDVRPAQEFAEAQHRLRTELERLGEFVDAPTTDAVGPVTRARTLLADDLYEQLPAIMARSPLGPPSPRPHPAEVAMRCVQYGVTDPATVEHLLMCGAPDIGSLRDNELSVSGIIALANHRITSVEDRALMTIAGAETVSEICAVMKHTKNAYTAAFDALYPEHAAIRDDGTDLIEVTEYAFFCGASITDRDEMSRRNAAGISGLDALELTAMGIVNPSAQAEAVHARRQIPVYTQQHLSSDGPGPARFAAYVQAEFDSRTLHEALRAKLPPSSVAAAHGVGFDAPTMLQLHLGGKLETALEFPDFGVSDASVIEKLMESGVSPRLYEVYRAAKITDVNGMITFRRAGLVTPEAVAEHMEAARSQARIKMPVLD